MHYCMHYIKFQVGKVTKVGMLPIPSNAYNNALLYAFYITAMLLRILPGFSITWW